LKLRHGGECDRRRTVDILAFNAVFRPERNSPHEMAFNQRE